AADIPKLEAAPAVRLEVKIAFDLFIHEVLVPHFHPGDPPTPLKRRWCFGLFCHITLLDFDSPGWSTASATGSVRIIADQGQALGSGRRLGPSQRRRPIRTVAGVLFRNGRSCSLLAEDCTNLRPSP